jgi:hypothetical protein
MSNSSQIWRGMHLNHRPMGERDRAFLIWVGAFVALAFIIYLTRR